MLVALVVVVTPRPTDGPVAVSATTRPASAVVGVRSTAPAAAQIISVSQAPRLASFAPVPNAVAAPPATIRYGMVVADELPAGRERVHVKTAVATYGVQWGDIAFLLLDTRATVVNHAGELVAIIDDGVITVLVGR